MQVCLRSYRGALESPPAVSHLDAEMEFDLYSCGALCLLMIIGDLDIEGVAVLPPKADTILIVNSDAVLSHAISLQRLQTVRRRRRKITELLSVVDLNQTAQRNRGDLLKAFDPQPLKS